MSEQNGTLNRTRFHYLQPDYTRPPFEVPGKFREKILQKLKSLYSEECSEKCENEVIRIMQVYYAHKTPQMLNWEKGFDPENRFTEKDVILITYGDLITSPGEKPLQTLHKLSKAYLAGVFNNVHILPFFPYSSDRGFAVMDFEEVDPNLGTWEDILELKSEFKLMFDGVFNHVSSKSRWFQEFLNQNPDYLNFFTVFSTKGEISPDHLKLIVRPRTSDILTSFDTLYGPRLVWTTFSSDQIDLNYKNPKVLLKMIEILLTYVRRGADIIRLDAVTYLWEELGTSCVHLEQSHIIIRLFRDILNAVAPHVALITETNVPHADNVRYFGDGYNEAQMVYNFALPPLVLYTFLTGDAKMLTNWAAGLTKVSNEATYFNFLDSHDGIGVMAVRDILTPADIEMMALKVLEHGGYISYKANGDGTSSPYELNITWWSAINNDDADEPMDLQVKRYLASRAIALVLMGVPGIYLHGLLGSKNDAELVLEERSTRSINRKNIRKEELLKSLENEESTTYHVTRGLIRLIRKRIREKAFHPNADQRVLHISPGVFAVLRTSVDRTEQILALISIRNQKQKVTFNCKTFAVKGGVWLDLLSQQKYHCTDFYMSLTLEPYQIVWLKNETS
ncbi:MAG TPA: sugar phosphorylase [Caldithrix abyssi]|uniref:Sugar phosphorylase n=1 Tax=Caldithrix abyssi TaxID=187145 RepID=A0A7V4U5F4_CALAY|nr:sugar phosphorylase [Caldithrix abyssi]